MSSENPSVDLAFITRNIWLKPRLVFSRIKEQKFSDYAYTIVFLAGFTSGIIDGMDTSYAHPMNAFLLMGLRALIGGCFGILFGYLYYMALAMVGRWLGGNCHSNFLFKSMSYAHILTIPFWVVTLLFAAFSPEENQQSFWVKIPFALFVFTMLIWSLVVYLKGYSEIQDFSVARTIANHVITFLLVIGTIAILGLLITGAGFGLGSSIF